MKKADIIKRELNSTAFHEAGHAVAHLKLGVPFRHVTIKPNSENLGHIHTPKSSKTRYEKKILKDLPLTPKDHYDIENMCIMLLAGPLAEAKHLKKKNWMKYRAEDHDKAMRFLWFSKDGATPIIEAYIKYIVETTRFYLSWNQWWPDIALIAKTLNEKTTLSYNECKALLLPKP